MQMSWLTRIEALCGLGAGRMRALPWLLIVLLAGCATGTGQSNGLSRIAKSDIDEVIELHQRAVMRDLQGLMIKLYYRNPGLRHDRDARSIEDSVQLTFSLPHDHVYPQWQAIREPTDIIRMSLDPRFHGDRVLAFIVGLRSMLMAAYDGRSEFYYLTSIDGQKLYNSARNIEIAAWLLAERRDADGSPLILSDSYGDEQRNLSYQRLIGRMIATQDNLAQLMAQKNGRIIKTVVVQAATMMFLPI